MPAAVAGHIWDGRRSRAPADSSRLGGMKLAGNRGTRRPELYEAARSVL
jgi:hypothetical protein